MIVEVLHDLLPPLPREDEKDNLAQAEAVAAALRARGHEARLAAFGPDLEAASLRLRRERPDLVFNLVESVLGHSRLAHTAPALLESLGIPFTGCGSHAVFTGADKLRVKELLRLAGVPTPRWHTLDRLERGEKAAAGRYILKPVHEHGSVGLDAHCVVHALGGPDLAARLRVRSLDANMDYFAEVYVDGPEFNVALLERDGRPEALPLAGILFEDHDEDLPRILGYDAKWVEDSHAYNNTPRDFDLPDLGEQLRRDLRSLGMACWVLFEMRGYARVDLRSDAAGRAYVIDVNPNPCIAPDAGFAAAGERAGLDYPALVDAVARAAAGENAPTRAVAQAPLPGEAS